MRKHRLKIQPQRHSRLGHEYLVLKCENCPKHIFIDPTGIYLILVKGYSRCADMGEQEPKWRECLG